MNAAAGELPWRAVAGIDEAGLGPLLGPLCLGFTVLRFPEGPRTLWQRLAPVVTPDPARDRAAFVVADSKLVFDRTPRAGVRLEATALGFLALLHPRRRPQRPARELLWDTPRALGPSRAAVQRHPWYAAIEGLDLPVHQDGGLLELAVERLSRKLREQEIELVDAGVRVVPEGELNRSFERTQNKGATHWSEEAALYRHLWEAYAPGGLELVVDRLGGRCYYGEHLASAFPEARLSVVRERSNRSEYLLAERRPPESGPTRRMRIVFATKADRCSFPVALASCLAKYARETCMRSFNAYFGALQEGLRPTAGYRTDGWRWLAEAAPAIERAGLGAAALLRQR